MRYTRGCALRLLTNGQRMQRAIYREYGHTCGRCGLLGPYYALLHARIRHRYGFLARDRRIRFSHVRGGECKLTTALYVHGASVGIEPHSIVEGREEDHVAKRIPTMRSAHAHARCHGAMVGDVGA